MHDTTPLNRFRSGTGAAHRAASFRRAGRSDTLIQIDRRGIQTATTTISTNWWAGRADGYIPWSLLVPRVQSVTHSRETFLRVCVCVLRACNVVTLRSLCICTAFLHHFRLPIPALLLTSFVYIALLSYPRSFRNFFLGFYIPHPFLHLLTSRCRKLVVVFISSSNLGGNNKVEDARTRKTQGRSEEKRRVFFLLPMNKGVPIR